MPAERLGGRAVRFSRFDVVGADSDTEENFVRHLAIAGADGDVPAGAAGVETAVVHMGPPLTVDAVMEANVVGSAPLSADEAAQVGLFADEHALEHSARRVGGSAGYVVRPHASEEREADGTITYRRFSCVGFVIEAYRDAGIDMVDTEEAPLPRVDLQTLARAYPDLVGSGWRRLNVRYRLGLDGDGPWAVVLAGYVLHALGRSPEEIRTARYAPVAGDEYFPRRVAVAGEPSADKGPTGVGLTNPTAIDRPTS